MLGLPMARIEQTQACENNTMPAHLHLGHVCTRRRFDTLMRAHTFAAVRCTTHATPPRGIAHSDNPARPMRWQDAPKKKKGPTRCGPDFKWAKQSLLCEAVEQNVRRCLRTRTRTHLHARTSTMSLAVFACAVAGCNCYDDQPRFVFARSLRVAIQHCICADCTRQHTIELQDVLRCKKLIARGEDVNEALHYAIGRGRLEIVSLFLQVRTQLTLCSLCV